MNDDKPQPHARRIFLKQVATLVSVAPLAGEAGAAAPGARAGATARATPATAHAWRFLNAEESRALEAAVARLIPADDDGPGAAEAGVAAFIDLQLAGAWGNGEQFYQKGPFAAGTPQQGYQLAFTPAAMFRLGLAKLDESARKSGGAAFADLPAAQQDEMLAQAEHGKLDFGPLPSAVFFASLLDATMEGFFSDPIYGGNRDKIGWKLVGFPGVAAVYTTFVDKHGVPYNAEPVSIVDILERRAEVDEHGHPKHVLLAKKER